MTTLPGLGHRVEGHRDLLGKHAVTDLDGVEHRTRRDLEGLDHKRAQQHDGRHHDGEGNDELYDPAPPGLFLLGRRDRRGPVGGGYDPVGLQRLLVRRHAVLLGI